MLKSSVSRIRSFNEEHAFVFPLVLLFSALIGYGIFGLLCGFYWDDWPPVLLSNIHKAGVFWNAYGDRPFSAWTYVLMFPLLGNTAWAWQLANIVLRVVGVYFFYLTLVEVMPRQKPLFQWAALLSLFLPIFGFQYIAVAFSQHFFTFAIFAASLYLLLLSVKKPRFFWLFFPLSLILTAMHMFMMEYFVALEVLRPIFLFLTLRQQGLTMRKAIGKTLLLLLPAMFVLGIYLYWRLILFPVVQGSDATFSNNVFWVGELVKGPIAAIKHLLSMMIEDFRTVFVTSWIDRLWPVDLQYSSKVLWLSLGVGLAVSGLFACFFGQIKEEQPELSTKQFFGNLGLGLLIFFVGILPVWVTLRQVSEGKYSERFVLAALPGIALILVSLIWKIAASGRMRYFLLSLLVMVCIGYQIQTGNVYRKDYQKQQSFYAQLKWRMPELKAETAIYSPYIVSGREADYSLSMAINLLYDNNIQDSLKYWFFTPRDFAVTNLLAKPDLALSGVIRGPEFTGVASQMIAVYLPDEGCLLALDPIYAQYPAGVEDFASYGELSNFNQVVDRSDEPLPAALEQVSSRQWCYYFEKADLARQQQDWARVIDLYDTATQLGYSPIESVEYIPLIQALGETGHVEEAIQTTQQALKISKVVNSPACKLWQDLQTRNPAITSEQISGILSEAGCPVTTP